MPDCQAIDEAAALVAFRTGGAIVLASAIRVLNAARVSYALGGSLGLSGWRVGLSGWRVQARVESQLEFFVTKRHLETAQRALTDAFPHLRAIRAIPRQVQLQNQQGRRGTINLIVPVHLPEIMIFKNCQRICIEGQSCRIPTLEMALAMKFGASSSLYQSEEERLIASYDFALMVNRNSRRNDTKHFGLASGIMTNGARALRKLIGQVRARPVV